MIAIAIVAQSLTKTTIDILDEQLLWHYAVDILDELTSQGIML